MRLCAIFIFIISSRLAAQCNYNDTPDYAENNITTCVLETVKTSFTGQLNTVSDEIDIFQFVSPEGMEVYEVEFDFDGANNSDFAIVTVLFSNSTESHIFTPFNKSGTLSVSPLNNAPLCLSIGVSLCQNFLCGSGTTMDWNAIVKFRPKPKEVYLDSPDLPEYCSSVKYGLIDSVTRFHGSLSSTDLRDEWIIDMADYVIDLVILVMDKKVHPLSETKVTMNDNSFYPSLLSEESVVWDEYAINEFLLDVSIESEDVPLNYALIIYAHVPLLTCDSSSCNMNDLPDFPDVPSGAKCCITESDSSEIIFAGILSGFDSLDTWKIQCLKGATINSININYFQDDFLGAISITLSIGTRDYVVDLNYDSPSKSYVLDAPFDFTEMIIKIQPAFWLFDLYHAYEIEFIPNECSTTNWVATNDDWQTISNWSCGVPNYTKEVVNETVGSDPVISDCGKSKTITIEKGAGLTVDGQLVVIPE